MESLSAAARIRACTCQDAYLGAAAPLCGNDEPDLGGAEIPAAAEVFAILIERVAAIANEGRLAPTVEEAADLLWASANAASLLHVTAHFRKTAPPTSAALEQIRENAMRSILNSETKGRSQ